MAAGELLTLESGVNLTSRRHQRMRVDRGETPFPGSSQVAGFLPAQSTRGPASRTEPTSGFELVIWLASVPSSARQDGLSTASPTSQQTTRPQARHRMPAMPQAPHKVR
jgi:hypothetical protein